MSARTYTFNADRVSGNAAASCVALFAGSVYPLAVRLTNHMPRNVSLPGVGVLLKHVSDAGGGNSAVVTLNSADDLARLASDVEQIAETGKYVPALTITDDVTATGATEEPDTSYPMTWHPKLGIAKAANGKTFKLVEYENNTLTGMVGIYAGAAIIPSGIEASMMWMGDSLTAASGDPSHPLMERRVPYHSSSAATWSAWIRGARAKIGTPAGAGTLTFDKAEKTLTWAANGESAGPAVDVSLVTNA